MSQDHSAQRRRTSLVVAAWLWVGVPFLYGVYQLSTKVTLLFQG